MNKVKLYVEIGNMRHLFITLQVRRCILQRDFQLGRQNHIPRINN